MARRTIRLGALLPGKLGSSASVSIISVSAVSLIIMWAQRPGAASGETAIESSVSLSVSVAVQPLLLLLLGW